MVWYGGIERPSVLDFWPFNLGTGAEYVVHICSFLATLRYINDLNNNNNTYNLPANFDVSATFLCQVTSKHASDWRHNLITLTFDSDVTMHFGTKFECRRSPLRKIWCTFCLSSNRPTDLDLWPSKWGDKLPVPLASFLPIFSLLCPSVLNVGPGTGQRDRWTDRRRPSMLNAHPEWAGAQQLNEQSWTEVDKRRQRRKIFIKPDAIPVTNQQRQSTEADKIKVSKMVSLLATKSHWRYSDFWLLSLKNQLLCVSRLRNDLYCVEWDVKP